MSLDQTNQPTTNNDIIPIDQDAVTNSKKTNHDYKKGKDKQK